MDAQPLPPIRFRPVGRCIDCANHFVWNGDRCGRDDSLIRDPYEKYDCFKSSEPEIEEDE